MYEDKADGQPAEWVRSVRQVMRHRGKASGGDCVEKDGILKTRLVDIYVVHTYEHSKHTNKGVKRFKVTYSLKLWNNTNVTTGIKL